MTMAAESTIEGTIEAPASGVMASRETAGDILIIEDDPEIVTMLVWFLQVEEGLAVHAAFNSAEALRRITPEPPALVLLDMTIPGEQCAETIAKLRAREGWARVPIVLCSGQESVATASRELGTAGYILKPFDLDELAALAHRYARPEKAAFEA